MQTGWKPHTHSRRSLCAPRLCESPLGGQMRTEPARIRLFGASGLRFTAPLAMEWKRVGKQTSRRAKAELGISSLFARLSCEVPRTFFTFFGGCFFNALEWNPFKNNFDNFPRMGKFPPPNVSWPSKPRI